MLVKNLGVRGEFLENFKGLSGGFVPAEILAVL